MITQEISEQCFANFGISPNCILSKIGPFVHHVSFLVQNSPRAADLSATIYRRIFTLTASEEENETVQYIIATIEPPPPHLQKSPWLACDPLSSDSPSQRFLKTII